MKSDQVLCAEAFVPSSMIAKAVCTHTYITFNSIRRSTMFPHGIFHAGELEFWKLGQHFQFARMLFAIHSASLHSLMENSTVFTVVMHYDVSQAMYRKARRYRKENSKLLQSTELKGIGKSSIHMTTILRDPDTKEFLASLWYKYVYVDTTTRSSKRIPEWFLKQYDVFNPGSITPAYRGPTLPSDNSVHCKMYTFLPSDLDRNDHVNNNVYYRLFFDAATEASVTNNLFSGFEGDICSYFVKSTSCVYEKECRLGDLVHILVWEDHLQAKTLQCKIVKGTENSFQCTVVFYDQLSTMPSYKSLL